MDIKSNERYRDNLTMDTSHRRNPPTMIDYSNENAAAISLCSLGRDTSALMIPKAGIALPNNDDVADAVRSTPSAESARLPSPQMNPQNSEKPDESTARRKYKIKPRDPRRDTSVSFDEMKRLMRVYGPIKCLRNRTPKDSGKTTKIESIRRKFYRWFPDFEDRFEKTPEGWYKPIFGHKEEMAHRENSRKIDQDELVKKRFMKRCGSKLKDAPSESETK